MAAVVAVLMNTLVLIAIVEGNCSALSTQQLPSRLFSSPSAAINLIFRLSPHTFTRWHVQPLVGLYISFIKTFTGTWITRLLLVAFQGGRPILHQIHTRFGKLHVKGVKRT